MADHAFEASRACKKAFTGVSPITIISSALLVTVLVGAFAISTIARAYRDHEAALRLDARLQALSDQILHHEDTKDMAALMAVETADSRWMDRYEAEVQKLDRALRAAISEAPDANIRDEAVEAEKINLGLVNQERLALELVRKGDSRRAAAILSRPQYVLDEQRYRKEMAAFNAHLRIWTATRVQAQEANIGRALSLFAAVGVAVLVLWIGVIRVLRKNIGARLQHMAELSEAVKRLTHSEKTLQESEERFRYALRATSDIIWDWNAKDDTGGVLSPKFCEEFAIRTDGTESPYEQWLDLVHPDDRPGLEESLRSRTNGNNSFWEFQYRLRRPDGTYATFHDRAYVLRDESGAPIRLVGAMQDLSERKEQEAAIAEAEKMKALTVAAQEAAETANREYARRFEQAPLPIWIYDLETLQFLNVNEAAVRHYGYSRPEVLRMSILDIRPQADREETVGRVNKARENFCPDRQTHRRSRHQKRDGTIIEVELFCLTLLWEGRPAELVYVNDITQQAEASKLLEAAKVKAEVANKAKSEFLANMSHEIRTPLNGIMGMTELALATPCTAEQADYLQSIEHSAQALLVVINDVLDFSKIEAHKLDLNVTEMMPAEIVEQAVKTMAVSAHRKGLELNCDIDPDVPACVVGDPFRLRQVLINLIGNAVKFTAAGEVNVHLRKVRCDQRDCRLAFSVSDTGIGVPEDKQAIIFDKFTQADASTSRVYGGTGLGLAISRALVEMMGGSLDLVSSTIEGSTFSFELSLPVGHSLLPSAEVALDGLRVLVVDDNATNRAILVRMLAGWQMEVATAEDGEEALVELRRAASAGGRYDVVLTDARMPRLDGFGLIEGLKRDPALAHTAILMLTSDDQAGDAARCRELGISLYLVKPVRQAQLKDALRKAIGKSPQREVAVSKPIAAVSSGPLRILLAEDNLVNQKIAVRSLEKLNYTVTVASTGREALMELENSSFDLVLMDVQMPEMDGYEATAAIRARAADYRNIPIIAMTAHAMQGDRERCLAAGMTDYLSKPLKLDDLNTMIEKHAACGTIVRA